MKAKLAKATIFMSAAFITLMFASSVFAESEMFKLDLNNQTFQGENTLSLKKMIKAQNPGSDLRSMDLEKVILIAKSKQGKGKAWFKVGYDTSDTKSITGLFEDFSNPAAYTYDRVRYKNKTGNSQGKWQIDLKGKLIVKKILVFAKKHFTPSILLDTISLGQHPSKDSTYVNIRGIEKLIIKASQGTAVIKKVVVEFANGRTKELLSMTGPISAGQKVIANLNGKAVHSIKVVAKSKGRHATIKLLAKTQQFTW